MQYSSNNYSHHAVHYSPMTYFEFVFLDICISQGIKNYVKVEDRFGNSQKDGRTAGCVDSDEG